MKYKNHLSTLADILVVNMFAMLVLLEKTDEQYLNEFLVRALNLCPHIFKFILKRAV